MLCVCACVLSSKQAQLLTYSIIWCSNISFECAKIHLLVWCKRIASLIKFNPFSHLQPSCSYCMLTVWWHYKSNVTFTFCACSSIYFKTLFSRNSLWECFGGASLQRFECRLFQCLTNAVINRLVIIKSFIFINIHLQIYKMYRHLVDAFVQHDLQLQPNCIFEQLRVKAFAQGPNSGNLWPFNLQSTTLTT